MTTRATAPIKAISDQANPSIAGAQARVGQCCAGSRSGWDALAASAVMTFGVTSGCGPPGRSLILHPRLERFDALGEITHQIGDPATAAEQQQEDRDNDQPVPNAKGTHETTTP